jgi:iron complex outermembrane receptor protein
MNLHSPVRATVQKRLGSVKVRKLAMLMAAMAATLQLVPTPVVAQANATGAVQGRVLNAANGMYLNNARVTVEGTSLETFTNEFGDYTLNNVPAGQVTLKTSYTGQEPQLTTVTVESGKTLSQNISFNTDQSTIDDDGMIVLNEFVVASDRFKNAQEIATNEERFSPSIKSVVATDSLGFVPGGNVGEFVKFLPGVQVGYGGGNTVNPSTASSIEVRGFGADQTTILIDGLPVSSADAGALTRQTGLDTLSINNASRIEVTKVATPDMAAESAGGTVNLITKSAFEFTRPTINASLYVTTNSEDTKLTKQQGPTDEKSFHTLPGGRVSVALPLSDKLGLSISLASDNQYSPTSSVQADWQRSPATFDNRPFGGEDGAPVTNAHGEQASLVNPYLRRTTTSEFAWSDYRTSGNVKLDWKPFTGMLINANVNYSNYKGYSTQRSLAISANAPMDWGPDYTIGRIGINTDSEPEGAGNEGRMTVRSFDKVGDTLAGYLKLRYNKGPFSIDGQVSSSESNLKYEDLSNGHFSDMEVTLEDVGQVRFDGINNGVPARTTITNPDGSTLDHTSISSWTNSSLQAKSQDNKSKSTRNLYNLNARYQLDFLPFDLAAKAGFSRDERIDKRFGRGSTTFDYIGPDPDTDDDVLTASQLIDPHGRRSPGYGLPAQEWTSVYALYRIYAENPSWFSDSAEIGTQAANLRAQLTQQKDVKETSDAYYGMIESKLFDNRLTIIAGGRQTKRKRVANQSVVDTKWNYVKNPDGSLYTDNIYRQGVKFDFSNAREWNPNTPEGAPHDAEISDFDYTTDGDPGLMGRLQAAGAIHPGYALKNPDGTGQANTSNNLEAVRYAYGIKEITSQAKDPISPQVQVAYRVTDSLTAKMAWSREVALPKLESTTAGILTNNFQINEFIDPQQIQERDAEGEITMSNAALKPQKTNSLNFELSYYFNNGGKISASYYYKEIENVWERVTIPASDPSYAILLDTIGLDAALYPRYILSSTINGARTAKNTGYEIEVRQNLEFLGRYGRYFNVFANYSHKDVTRSEPSNDVVQILSTSADDTYSGGIQFATNRLQIAIRGNYVAENLQRTTNGILFNGVRIAAYDYTPEEYRVNVQLDYNITKRYSFFFSANNILNRDRKTQFLDAAYVTPAYASTEGISTFGVTMTTGINAKF